MNAHNCVSVIDGPGEHALQLRGPHALGDGARLLSHLIDDGFVIFGNAELEHFLRFRDVTP